MSIKFLDKSQSIPSEVLLAGTPQTDQILNPSSKNAIANKTVYNALSEKVSKTVNDLVNYYTKSDVYNKQEIRELIGAIETLTMEVVNALPSSDISTTTIYLLKQTGSSNYDEYVYINNEWVKIGTTQIDLSGYVTTSQLNQAIADFLTETEINLLLSAKQDKNLSSSVTIGSETVGTVEDAISEVADVIPSTASANNKLATAADVVTVIVDDELSGSSENPVQNKVIKSALDEKQSSTLSSPIGGETLVEGVLNATDAALSNYINFAGAKNMLPCFLGNRLQYGIDFTLNDNGSITMNGTSTGNPAYYAFAGENNGTASSPLLYKLAKVGLNKFLSFKVKITDAAIAGVGLRIYFYDSTGTIIPNPGTSTNYINCSTSVTIDFNTGYYSNAEYVAFMLTVSKDTVLVDATVYPLIYEINEYTRNSAYFPWAMTNRDLTTDVLKHTSWTDISKIGAVNFLENNAVTTVDSTAGLTYTVNADKSVTVSATSGTYPFTVLANSNLVLYEADGTEPYVGKQIKISGCPKGGSDAYHIQAYRANSVDGSTGTIKEYGNGVIFDWLNDGSGIKAKVSIVLRKDLEMEGPLEFYPMITLTNYQGDYASYAMTNRELTEDVAENSSSINALTNQVKDMNNVYGSKNLLPNKAITQVSYGVTFTVNDDGSVKANGTNDGTQVSVIFPFGVARNLVADYFPSMDETYVGYMSASNTLLELLIIWEDENKTTISQTRTKTKVEFTIPSNAVYFRCDFRVAQNATVSNEMAYPMICLKSVYDLDSTYEPYAKTNHQLTQDSVTWDDLSEVGAVNYLDSDASTTINSSSGLTFTVNSDKTVTVSATSGTYPFTVTANASLALKIKPEFSDKLPLKLSGCPSGGDYSTKYRLQYANYSNMDGLVVDTGDGGIITNQLNYTTYPSSRISIEVRKDYVMTGPLTFYPMLTDPSYNGPYVPYAMTNRELTEKTVKQTNWVQCVIKMTSNALPTWETGLSVQDATDVAEQFYDLFKRLGGETGIGYTCILQLQYVKASDGTNLGSSSGFARIYSAVTYSSMINNNSTARFRLTYEPYGYAESQSFGLWGTLLSYAFYGRRTTTSIDIKGSQNHNTISG